MLLRSSPGVLLLHYAGERNSPCIHLHLWHSAVQSRRELEGQKAEPLFQGLCQICSRPTCQQAAYVKRGCDAKWEFGQCGGQPPIWAGRGGFCRAFAVPLPSRGRVSAGGRRQNVLAVGRRLSGRVIFLQRLGYDQVSVLPSVYFGGDFASRHSVNQYVESHRCVVNPTN